jgi:hypothetical protein
MTKSDFVIEIEKHLINLKKASKKLDLSHISAEGMEETPKVGIPFNKALSYLEAAKELVDQAIKNLNTTIKETQKSKSK